MIFDPQIVGSQKGKKGVSWGCLLFGKARIFFLEAILKIGRKKLEFKKYTINDHL